MPEHTPTPRPSSRRIRLALAAAALLVGGSGAAVVWVRQPPSVVTVDDAVARFRAAQAVPEPEQTAATAAAPDPTAAAAPDDAGAPTTATAPPPTQAPAVPEATAPAEPDAAGPAGATRLPDPGVYTFDTEGGGETNALGGARHDYPPQTPFVVEHTPCGFDARWQPLQERWDEWELCGQDGRRTMNRITTYHEFFRKGQRQDFDCGGVDVFPPERTPGHTFTWTCSTATSRIEATTTVVGSEELRLADGTIPTVHYRHDTVLHGGNEGTQTMDWWLHAETGMPVRMIRTVDTRSDSPFGKVDYRERFTTQVVSMTPQR